MNINARLDHLLDKFKHDLRDLIDSARAEERSGVMNRLESFLETDDKPKFAVGGIVEKTDIIVGEKDIITITQEDVLSNSPKVQEAIKINEADPLPIPKKSRLCIICGDSIEGTHKRRKICTKESCRKQYVNDYQKKIKERQAEGIKKRLEDTSRPVQALPADTPPESNRPLMEFVGTKKKKPFICGFCGKPCDDRYCSPHCESEDKRLSNLTKGKSYSELLQEKGLKVRKSFHFSPEDRHGG